jgi:hypothetical protein
MVEPRKLFALVANLGYSRRPAVHFAMDRTRTTTLTRLALTLDGLGGATNHVRGCSAWCRKPVAYR